MVGGFVVGSKKIFTPENTWKIERPILKLWADMRHPYFKICGVCQIGRECDRESSLNDYEHPAP